MCSKNRTPLGERISRRAASVIYKETLPGVPAGKYVVIQFDASFANKKVSVETVTMMLDNDGKWRLSGYYIR